MTVARPSASDFDHHKNNQENHRLSNSLRDIILGGQDGLVNALGIVLGFAAVSSDAHILIPTVLAASAAEAISMAAVAYTSANAQKDHYEAELIKEKYEIEKYPEMETEEVRRIFEQKGFKGKVLEEIVQTITADKKIWLETMMRDELGLEKVNTKNMLKSSVIVGVTTALGSIVPVIPFFFVAFYSFHIATMLAIIACAVTLFCVGIYQALSLVGTWWKTGVRIMLIGLSSAFIGFCVAKLIQPR